MLGPPRSAIRSSIAIKAKIDISTTSTSKASSLRLVIESRKTATPLLRLYRPKPSI